jgi:hypothetical protein
VIELAHAGHWLASVAYALPVLVLPPALVALAAVARHRERRSGSGAGN